MAKLVTAGRMAVAAGALVAVLPFGTITPAFADTSPGPSVMGPNGPIICAPEQYPHGGAPRNASSVPYQIPFTATLGLEPGVSEAMKGSYPAKSQGGYFEIEGSSSALAGEGLTVTVVLGASPDGTASGGRNSPGQLYATGCGTVNIPSEKGGIGPVSSSSYRQPADVNPNFVFSPNAPVGISISPTGIVLPNGATVGNTTADGFLSSSISPTPAANGGLNVTFSGSFRSTTDFTGIFDTLSGLLSANQVTRILAGLPASVASLLNGAVSDAGNTCTIAIGNLATDGLSPAATKEAEDDEAGNRVMPAPAASQPVTFTTQMSGAMRGSPVTGPIAPNAAGDAQDQAALVSNNFWVGAITSSTPDVNGKTGDCSPDSAALLNTLLGLPSKPGANYFYAPATFGVYTSS